MRKKRKVTLTYKQISYLVAELADLLQKEIKIVSRYHLHTLNRIVSEQMEQLTEMRNGLIEMLGEPAESGKGYEIKQGTAAALQFEDEMNELLSLELELELPEIYLSDLDGIESDKHYGIFFNLING